MYGNKLLKRSCPCVDIMHEMGTVLNTVQRPNDRSQLLSVVYFAHKDACLESYVRIEVCLLHVVRMQVRPVRNKPLWVEFLL